jgi:thiamine-phosphate pyrophosphorylase
MSAESRIFPHGLYAICDDGVRPELSLIGKTELLIEGGAQVIQLRMKVTPSREAVVAARRIASLCRAAGAICLVNDRVDLALIAGAHGVHLGADDLPISSARALLGPEKIIGVTVRNLEMAKEAQAAGADYVGLGPVFPTSTKQVDAQVLGIEAFARIVRRSPLPTIGISGICLSNIGLIAQAGAHGAAVLSDLFNARDIPAHARALTVAFDAGQNR